jgi:hypothetical protein
MSVPTHSGIAQLAEHLTVNQGVVGSSPTPGATHDPPLGGSFCFRRRLSPLLNFKEPTEFTIAARSPLASSPDDYSGFGIATRSRLRHHGVGRVDLDDSSGALPIVLRSWHSRVRQVSSRPFVSNHFDCWTADGDRRCRHTVVAGSSTFRGSTSAHLGLGGYLGCCPPGNSCPVGSCTQPPIPRLYYVCLRTAGEHQLGENLWMVCSSGLGLRNDRNVCERSAEEQRLNRSRRAVGAPFLQRRNTSVPRELAFRPCLAVVKRDQGATGRCGYLRSARALLDRFRLPLRLRRRALPAT